jgi:hypothetical protein
MVDQRPGGLGLPGHVSRAAPAKNYARLFKSTSSAAPSEEIGRVPQVSILRPGILQVKSGSGPRM